MEIVVLFETGEGQTRKIAGFLADQLRASGHEPTLIEATRPDAGRALAQVERVILAAPVHERRHPKRFETLVRDSREILAGRATLMMSVSLKAAFPDGLDEAHDYLTEMKMRTGFTPTRELLVAGAVRPGSYDYFQSQIVRHVLLAGQDVDLNDGVQEFTDWDALAAAARSFLADEATARSGAQ